MTGDQAILFTLLFGVFVFLIWGRWRYDLVALVALRVALLTGVVPKAEAFSGCGHPATVIIALVLIVSRGLSNSGAIELLARYVIDASRKAGGAHYDNVGACSVAVGDHEQRGSARVADAARSASGQKIGPQPIVVPNAAIFCVNSRRHDYDDRHAAQYCCC